MSSAKCAIAVQNEKKSPFLKKAEAARVVELIRELCIMRTALNPRVSKSRILKKAFPTNLTSSSKYEGVVVVLEIVSSIGKVPDRER